MADVQTPYSVLFDAALSKLRDYDLAGLSQDDCYAVLSDYLRPACVRFKECQHSLGDRDDLLMCFSSALTDEEIEILSNEIVIAYLYANYIKTPMVLKVTLPSAKDFHAFSPGNTLANLVAFHTNLKKENEQLISMYSWSNSTIFGSGGAG